MLQWSSEGWSADMIIGLNLHETSSALITIPKQPWWPSGTRQTAIIRLPHEIYQQIHMQLANKSPHVLIVSKTNMHNNDTCLIHFVAYLFSCAKFSWIQLTLKIYYCQNFLDLRYM